MAERQGFEPWDRLHGQRFSRPAPFDHSGTSPLGTSTRFGGEGGIRTHGRVTPTHAFQACSFGHSDTSPSSKIWVAAPVPPQLREELPQEGRTIVFENPGGPTQSMVEPPVGGEVAQAAAVAGLGIARAVDQTIDTAVDQRAPRTWRTVRASRTGCNRSVASRRYSRPPRGSQSARREREGRGRPRAGCSRARRRRRLEPPPRRLEPRRASAPHAPARELLSSSERHPSGVPQRGAGLQRQRMLAHRGVSPKGGMADAVRACEIIHKVVLLRHRKRSRPGEGTRRHRSLPSRSPTDKSSPTQSASRAPANKQFHPDLHRCRSRRGSRRDPHCSAYP